jgi:FixJ family two-component response regulator
MEQQARESPATIGIVDGDAAVRDSLCILLATLDTRVQTYASAEEFLRELPSQALKCLITEVHLPGMSGLELLDKLHALGVYIPTIVLATHSDVPLAVRAMRIGAVDFLDKPFIERALLARVRQLLGSGV